MCSSSTSYTSFACPAFQRFVDNFSDCRGPGFNKGVSHFAPISKFYMLQWQGNCIILCRVSESIHGITAVKYNLGLIL